MWLLVLRCLGARAKFCSMKLVIQYSTERRTTPKQHDDAVDEQLGTEGENQNKTRLSFIEQYLI